MEQYDKLDRIFGELNSREFMFKVEGRTYSLPHLNTMKPHIMELRKIINEKESVPKSQVMMFLFERAGNTDFIKVVLKMRMKDAVKIYDGWWEWSGFTLPKYYRRGKH